MEKKYYTYRYRWSELNLVVDCTKCGNNIPLQDLESPPACNECGNVNRISWEQTLKELDIAGASKEASVHKKMMGIVDATLKLQPAAQVNCYHCKNSLVLPEDKGVEDYSCIHCNQPIHFTEFNGMDELIFYRAGSGKTDTSTLQMIAVRCISCGAPLEADPTKNTFHCKFCSTENILPPSMRYKVVLDDFFVGIRDSKIHKLSSFARDGIKIEQVLRENGRESFADDQLDEVLLQNRSNAVIYTQVTQEYGYLPPDKVLHEIFETTHNLTIVRMVGQRLQKPEKEIEIRSYSIVPELKEKWEKRVQEQKTKTKKSNRKTNLQIWGFVLVMLTLAVLMYVLNFR